MSMEAQDQNQDDQQLADDLQGDADFAAAFNNARDQQKLTPAEGTTSNADTSTVTPGDGAGDDPAAAAAAAQAAQEAEAAAAAERAAAEANAPVTITKAQLDAMQAKLDRMGDLESQIAQSTQLSNKAFGRIGSLQQTIDAIKVQASQGKAPSIKQLARLEKEFPELGQMLREDLADAFGGQSGDVTADQGNPGEQQEDGGKANGQPPAVEQTDPLNNPVVVKALQAKEMAIVDVIHPGWRGTNNPDGTRTPGLIDTPEFQQWRAGLSPTAQHLLGNTWDSNILKDAIAHFKADQAQRATQAQAQAEASKQRDKRLEDAMPATTGVATGAHAVDEDAAFEAGFKQVRSGRN
jgi:hypothetical protein